MLKQRIITASVLIPIFILAVLFLPNQYFALFLSVVVVLGGIEWSRLSGFNSTWLSFAYASILTALAFFIYFSLSLDMQVLIIHASMIWWLFALVLVIRYEFKLFNLMQHGFLLLVAGAFVLVPSWLSVVLLHKAQSDTIWVLLLFIIIWGADTIAYFAGRQWGKHRLASHVSPGKSLEGAVAAVLLTLLIGAVYTFYQQMDTGAITVFLMLCLITVLSSILGDLFESLIKRSANLKDSGEILPGHGGVLDRIDSITAAAPVFFCALYWSGYYS